MKNTYIDERPIKPSRNQKYEVEEEIEEDYEDLEEYNDDFEDYIEEDNEGEKSTATKEEFEDIKAFYENEIGRGSISPTKKSKIAKAFKNEEMSPLPTNKTQRISQKTSKCK